VSTPTSLDEQLAAALRQVEIPAAVGDHGPECGEIGRTVELLAPERAVCEGRTEELAFV